MVLYVDFKEVSACLEFALAIAAFFLSLLAGIPLFSRLFYCFWKAFKLILQPLLLPLPGELSFLEENGFVTDSRPFPMSVLQWLLTAALAAEMVLHWLDKVLPDLAAFPSAFYS